MKLVLQPYRAWLEKAPYQTLDGAKIAKWCHAALWVPHRTIVDERPRPMTVRTIWKSWFFHWTTLLIQHACILLFQYLASLQVQKRKPPASFKIKRYCLIAHIKRTDEIGVCMSQDCSGNSKKIFFKGSTKICRNKITSAEPNEVFTSYGSKPTKVHSSS